MGKIFHRNKRPRRPDQKSGNFRSRFQVKAELVDPISYLGGLEEAKYPILPINNNSTKKIEEEIENPLNRR